MGYALGTSRIISKPFADDFEIISNNERSDCALQDTVYAKATSMGLSFKPSKCRSLSIVGGKPTPVVFSLPDPESGERVDLRTLESDPYKFLGSIVSFQNSNQEHLKFLKEKISRKLENVDSTKVRAEYKVAIYSRYVLPSLRYHLTVHSLNKTHLDELDLVAQRFLKNCVFQDFGTLISRTSSDLIPKAWEHTFLKLGPWS